MTITILILGILFGAILQYADLNRFNVISGLALRKDFSVAKAIAISIGIGIILLNIEIVLGFASYHVKPFVVGGLIVGGLIFGMGMAILGYCPGTLAVSFGEGSVDAFIGIVGGLFGGVVYTVLLPLIKPVLGPNLGSVSLNSLVGTNILFFILIFIIGIAFILSAFWLQKIDKTKSKKWILSGIALAVLNVIVFSSSVANRPIGASTTFPYLGDLIAGITGNDYFNKIKTPGNWELIFLTGAFIAGLGISLIKKEFRLVLIHDNWKKYKDNSRLSRIIWAFTGGFVLIFGARMAGGCTSGHILSGGMQVAFSSLTFAIFVFIGLLVTGKIFYKNNS
ncbi:MAG TPA: transporter [Bacteroidetes bacterium]|nr:transporter [Bacteroidota bacterium]